MTVYIENMSKAKRHICDDNKEMIQMISLDWYMDN